MKSPHVVLTLFWLGWWWLGGCLQATKVISDLIMQHLGYNIFLWLEERFPAHSTARVYFVWPSLGLLECGT